MIFFFFHFVGCCGEVALIITKILTLTLNSKWKSKILCIEKLKENDRCSSQKKSCREQTGKLLRIRRRRRSKMMKNIANVCICVWNICIMYQCQYSLSKKDMLSSALQPSSHYPLLLVETVLHKLCCRTSPIFMNKNSPQNKFITQSFRKMS